MLNPISTRARGIIYVISIVISGLGVVAGPVFISLGMPAVAPIVTAIVAGVSGTAAVLARANLSSPAVGLTEDQVAKLSAEMYQRYLQDINTPAVAVNLDEQAAQALTAVIDA